MITVDDLLGYVPRLAALPNGGAWTRSRAAGDRSLDYSKAAKSFEVAGIRAARPEDPWSLVRWTDWLTKGELRVRDYQETVPIVGCALVDDSLGLMGAPRVARLSAIVAFCTLARSLLSADPSVLMTFGTRRRCAYARKSQLAALAQRVCDVVHHAPRRGVVSRRAPFPAGPLPANVRAAALVSPHRSHVWMRALCGWLDRPQVRATVYVPVDADEFGRSPYVLRGVGNGRHGMAGPLMKPLLVRRLDRFCKLSDEFGVLVEPLVVEDPDCGAWEIVCQQDW